MIIKLDSLQKSFGNTSVLNNITLSIDDGEFFFLLGPSGCGKTTLLRLIAGLEQPSAGTIWFDQTDVTSLAANQRRISMVFQNYALWPHMTVYENVAFGLEIKKIDAKAQAEKISHILDIVKLKGYELQYPNQLSGGQQQRVALARALVVEPRLILFDEPLSNLDANLRNEMRVELRRIQKKTHVTAIYVTHDQKEALTMADRIAVLVEGKIAQLAEPHEIYYRPASLFVAGFIGEANFFSGVVDKIDNDGIALITSELGSFSVPIPPSMILRPGVELTLSIRPPLAQIYSTDEPPPSNKVNLIHDVQIENSMFLGETQEYHCLIGKRRFTVIQSSQGQRFYKHGDRVILYLPRNHIMLFKG